MDLPKAKKATKIALQQLESCDKFKRTRLSRINEMEEAYYGKKRPNLLGRSNIPVPEFAKYIDELRSHLDESPILQMKHKRDSQILVAKKLQSLIELKGSPEEGDWARKDRMQRILAIFSGVGIYDFYTEVDNGLKYVLDIVDPADAYFEPTGGSDFEDHAYVGKGNIFRSVDYLEKRAEQGVYDKQQVEIIKKKMGGDDYKRINKSYLSRFEKYKALGLNMDDTFIGQKYACLAQWQMEFEGDRYYLLFEMATGEPLRFDTIENVFGINKYSMLMWQTHEDPHNVLSKSPADDLYPLAEAFALKYNQFIDNHTKRIWGQKIIDPRFFPDPGQLEWRRPDQIIIGKSVDGLPVSSGLHIIDTPDATGMTVEFLNFTDKLLAQIAGVDPGSLTNDEERVGVLYGKLQKEASRLGVYNKSYNECWMKIAQRAIAGAKKYLGEPELVKIIGNNGVEWDELKKEELDHEADFDIAVVGSNVEIEMGEAKKKRQEDTIKSITANPDLMKEVSAKFMVEEMFRISGFNEDQIRRAMDVKNYGNEAVISHAAMSIEMILKGKEPKIYQGANIAFMEYIQNFARENNVPLDKFQAMMNYALQHTDIVARNMVDDITKLSMQTGQPVPSITATAQPVAGVSPEREQTPASIGQEASGALQGNV